MEALLSPNKHWIVSLEYNCWAQYCDFSFRLWGFDPSICCKFYGLEAGFEEYPYEDWQSQNRPKKPIR